MEDQSTKVLLTNFIWANVDLGNIDLGKMEKELRKRGVDLDSMTGEINNIIKKHSEAIEETKEVVDYSHVYLYAKHHYKETEPTVDLKIIIGKWCGIGVEHIGTSNVLRILLGLTFKSILQSGNPEYHFEDFVLDLLPANTWKVGYTPEFYEIKGAIIYKCLSVLRLTSVKDGDRVLLNLGEPDYSILDKPAGP